MSWSRAFDAPIALPDGGELTTLRQAGEYVAALPAAEQKEPHWRTATLHLLSAAEHGGIVMLAEIAMRQALGHGHERAAASRLCASLSRFPEKLPNCRARPHYPFDGAALSRR